MDPLATVRDKFNSGSLDVFSTKELVHFVTNVEYAVSTFFATSMSTYVSSMFSICFYWMLDPDSANLLRRGISYKNY